LSAAARPLRGEARRGLLLEAALRVIAAEGPRALTHRRVAAEAGLPLAATTYWFESRDELMREAYRLAVERDLARVRELAAATADVKPDRLGDALADLIAGELAEHRAALMAAYAMWLEAARRPDLRDIEPSWTGAYTEVMAGLLARAGAPDPPVAARLLVAALDGLVLAELSRDAAASADELRPLIRRLVAALLAPA
jgi:TetR/AcrR family transcriptional regulator, regulator of biofilm formation and stress response